MGEWGKVILLAGLTLITVIVIAGLGLSAYMARMQARTWIYPPRELRLPALAAVGLPSGEEIEFSTADGLTLRGWFVAADAGSSSVPADSSSTRVAPTILLLHGLGSNRSGLLYEAKLVTAHGYNALLFDQRGHGFSDGAYTTLGLLESEDVRAAVAYLLTRSDVDSGRIAILGHSLGGAVALRAAARSPEIKAVIAISAFTSITESAPQIVRALTGRPPIPSASVVLQFIRWEIGGNVEEVRPIDDIATIAPRPVLLIHGAEDPTIPVRNSEELFAAAGEPRELFIAAGVGHSDFTTLVPDAYSEHILGFLDRYLGAK